MKRILISLLLCPFLMNAGQSNSTPKDLRVKMMVEILNRTPAAGSNAMSEESLAHAYNIYDEKTGFGTPHKTPSDDLQYNIPVFGCSASSVNGITTYRIDFEAIHNESPCPEQKIEEDIDTLLENDPVERDKRTNELIRTSHALVMAFYDPIAQDNREFSLNEFKEYKTRLPNIIVKAGAYIIQDKQ